MNYSRENVGAHVWVRRCRVGMSQQELADRLDVSSGWVSRLETGSALPSLTRVLEFCALFECTPNELLTGALPEGI